MRESFQPGSPQQAVIAPITDKQAAYARECANALIRQGFRVATDLRNEKIGFKIREHEIGKLPYILVVGDKEREQGTVSVRARHGQDLGSQTLDDLAARLRAEVERRGRSDH